MADPFKFKITQPDGFMAWSAKEDNDLNKLVAAAKENSPDWQEITIVITRKENAAQSNS